MLTADGIERETIDHVQQIVASRVSGWVGDDVWFHLPLSPLALGSASVPRPSRGRRLSVTLKACTMFSCTLRNGDHLLPATAPKDDDDVGVCTMMAGLPDRMIVEQLRFFAQDLDRTGCSARRLVIVTGASVSVKAEPPWVQARPGQLPRHRGWRPRHSRSLLDIALQGEQRKGAIYLSVTARRDRALLALRKGEYSAKSPERSACHQQSLIMSSISVNPRCAVFLQMACVAIARGQQASPRWYW